jgi:hypothetical protein
MKKLIFLYILKVTEDFGPDPHLDPYGTKMSRIRNTAKEEKGSVMPKLILMSIIDE